jgi:hypothetical protein
MAKEEHGEIIGEVVAVVCPKIVGLLMIRLPVWIIFSEHSHLCSIYLLHRI